MQAFDFIQLKPPETAFWSTFSKKLSPSSFTPNFPKIKRPKPAQRQTGVTTCRATVYHSQHSKKRLFPTFSDFKPPGLCRPLDGPLC
jgi:hypothetical protein